MEERRELLNELGLDESIVFENPSYDNAIIGYDDIEHRVIYDYELMAECLMEQDGMSYEEAIEFIDYNTCRAIPYAGPNAPIVMHGIEDYLAYSENKNDFKYEFNANHELNKCVEWTRQWFEENGKGCSAVIGMSGGKDSTIAAAILCLALGCDRVIGVAMPENGQKINDADKICEYLGMKYIKCPIGDACDSISNVVLDSVKTRTVQTVQNIPPRIRMTMLFAIAQSINGRVVNTCNLSEEYIGYSTIYGDNAGSFSPIRNFTVKELLAIGDELGLPKKWVHKTPDDGLPHSKPDEEKFGFSYETLDAWIREGIKPSTEVFNKIIDMHNKNLFKTRMVNIPSYEPNLPIF
jgi:NAD+ synthase